METAKMNDVDPEAWLTWCRFLGRRALGLCDTDRCLASEKRSSGKSWGWSGWIDCCYGDLRNACVFAQS